MRQTAPGSPLRCHAGDKHCTFPSNSLFPHTITAELFICMQGAPTGYLHRIQASLCSQVIRGIQLHPVSQTKHGSPMSDTHGKTPSLIPDPWKRHSSPIPGWQMDGPAGRELHCPTGFIPRHHNGFGGAKARGAQAEQSALEQRFTFMPSMPSIPRLPFSP